MEDIHTYYGHSHVLQGISMAVAKGTVVALLGRNGAGKTTLIRSVIGFTPPRSGKIVFKGADIAHLAPEKRARMGVGLVPQGRRIFRSLSVRENLTVAAMNRAKGWSLERIYSLFPVLKQRTHQRAGKLSGGEQAMLATARGLRGEPDLLLMDEPSEGLAPIMVRELGQIIQKLKEGGLSILLIEQNLAFALEVADHVYIMSKGRIVYESAPEDLRRNEEAKLQHLGV